MYNQYFYGDELYHYGRKGMKWGQHIFQKYQEHRVRSSNRKAARSAKSAERKELKAAKAAEKKQKLIDDFLMDPTPDKLNGLKKDLTDEQLRQAVNRANMFAQIRNNYNKELNKASETTTFQNGFNKVDQVMKDIDRVNNWVDIVKKAGSNANTIYNGMKKLKRG